MTLAKALELLLINLRENEGMRTEDEDDALCIGIEAIEYMLKARRTHCVPVNNMLLHETKE